MYSDLNNLCVEQDRSILEAVTRMEISKIGIVLIVDENRRLVGTITDGDVRRALLDRVGFDQSVCVLLARKVGTVFAKPIAASIHVGREIWIGLMKRHRILHLPLLDERECVAGVVRLEELLSEQPFRLEAVVMAGGEGRRLMPLTEDLPKPMLPVGDRPLMETIIRSLQEAGVRKVKVTTHHKPEKIKEHFGDGRDFGVELSYVREDRPLGTAGGLGLMETPKETTLVINGDILTNVDYLAMLAFHKEHQADLTVAVRHYDIKVPYGVIECEGPVVRGLTEKPEFGVFVNAGIYLLEPVAYSFIPSGQRFDMTELIARLLDEGRLVVSFPIREYWLDVGDSANYQQAQEDAKKLNGPS